MHFEPVGDRFELGDGSGGLFGVDAEFGADGNRGKDVDDIMTPQ